MTTRSVLVLGGSGSIGMATCLKLNEINLYRVVSASRSPVEAFGDKVQQIVLPDTTNLGVFDKFLAQLEDYDVIINCLGITSNALVGKIRIEDVLNTVNINLNVNILLANRFLPSMLKNRFGRIVMLGSIIAEFGNIGQAVYSASKSGLRGLQKTLNREIIHHSRKGQGELDVATFLVEPGFVESRMTSSINPEILNKILSKKPDQKLIKPEDVAIAITQIIESVKVFNGGEVKMYGGLVM